MKVCGHVVFWTNFYPRICSQSLLERSTKKGDSPVGKRMTDFDGIQSSVPRIWGVKSGGSNFQP